MEEFVQVVKNYRMIFGLYSERILDDKQYTSRANRAFCKKNGIRISVPMLGCLGKDYVNELPQELKVIGERNAVEGKCGNGKRRLNMALIMAKLKETTCTMIMMDVYVLNMERLFQLGMLFSYSFLVSTIFIVLTEMQNDQLRMKVIKGNYSANPN